MKVFIKEIISDCGILGFLFYVFACVICSPLLLFMFIISCIADFNEWSMTWFDSEDKEEENER